MTSQAGGAITVTGSLTGDTQDADLYNPLGEVVLNGGTSSSPDDLEAMSQDLGSTPDGFTNNFAYGTLALGANTYVQLVDNAKNSGSTGPEALYADELVVPAGSTLDLNGLNVYVRADEISGTVVGGSITTIQGGGALDLGVPVAGSIRSASQVDDWSFFGRSNQAVTVIVNTGSDAPTPPIQPALNYAQVQLVDSDGNVLATASNSQSGVDVILSGVTLPGDGVYQVQVQAPSAQPSSTGNYVLTTWDATIQTYQANPNQDEYGQINSPFDTDQWTFSAQANTQIKFNLLAAASPYMEFGLTGPDGFTAFTGLTTSSDLLTLPSSGTYTLTVGGGAIGAYAFQLVQTTQTSLTLGTPYQGSLTGSGQAELFVVNVPTIEPLVATLQDLNPSDQNELYLKYGSPPTRSDYDYRYSNLAAANQQVLVPSAAPGTWYILLYGASVSSASSYTLTATAGSFLFGVSPSQGGTSADAILTLTGTGFTSQTAVGLIAADGTTYPISDVADVSPTEIMATVPAGSIPAGVYSVAITQPDGTMSSLTDAFTMIQGGEAVLTTHLIVPQAIGYHIASTIYVQYSNTGNVAMPAPLLVLSASRPSISGSGQVEGALMTLDPALQVSGFWT